MVGLSKQAEGVSLDASKAVAALLPAYTQLLETLKGLGVPEVQVIIHICIYCYTSQASESSKLHAQVLYLLYQEWHVLFWLNTRILSCRCMSPS